MAAGCVPVTDPNTMCRAVCGRGPAPRNLEVPTYTFLNDSTLRVG